MNLLYKIVGCISLLSCIAISAFTQSEPANAPERIAYFHSDITIDTTGKVTVTEKIKVYALGDKIKRGIYRSLPLKRDINGKIENIRYDIISVKKDGQKEDYHTKNENGYKVIYFGNKDIYLQNGFYEYELTYTTKNQIGFFENYDEFYWNVNGNYWEFPTDSISATVTLPLQAQIVQSSCYTGYYGNTEKNCESYDTTQNTISWHTDRKLLANEGLTIAVGFQKGIFLPPPPPTFMEQYGIGISLAIGLLFLFFYLLSQWRKYGIDHPLPIAYPQYEPPQNITPASMGYIQKGFYKNDFITASIVNLAVKGFIKITEIKKDGFLGLGSKKEFTIEKLKEESTALPKEELVLFRKLFNNNDTFKIDGDYDAKVATMVSNYKNTLHTQNNGIIEAGNNRAKIILPIIFVSLIYFIAIIANNIINNDDGFYLVFGTVVFIVGLVLLLIYMFTIRYYKRLAKYIWILPAIATLLILYIISVTDLGWNSYTFCFIFFMASFTLLFLFTFLIRQPSTSYLNLLSEIDGFKMYMGAAENQLLQFHNPPKMTPEIFEKLLPYAIVLGVEDIWGKRFQNILQVAGTAYANNWYVGNVHHFSDGFGSSLNRGLSRSINSASTAPSSSGSGGGGFSGGGGGGGGGGGW